MKTIAREFVVVALSLVCWTADVIGREDEPEYFSDMPVVLSASRLTQTIDAAPAAVTVIDQRTIKASGARDLASLFRLVPGMTVGLYNGRKATLGFHGFSDPYFRQFQVLIDGVSIYSPMWGGGEWGELPVAIEDIERLEVVRGPNAAAFGANAFLGVVNIITRDPATESRFAAATNIGESGIRDVLVRMAVHEGDLRYRLTAGQRVDTGLDSYPDDRRSNFVNLRGHYRLTGESELRLQAYYAGGLTQDGNYSDKSNTTNGPRDGNYDLGMVQLRWTRVRGADEEFWVQLFHSTRSHRETLPWLMILPRPFGTWRYPLLFDYAYQRTDIELQDTLRFGDSARGVWGAHLREDQARSSVFFGTSSAQHSTLYRLFGTMEWRPLPGWIVSGGAMWEDNNLSGRSISPNLALNRQFLPGHTLRLRWAEGRRTPMLYEERADRRYDQPEGLTAILRSLGSPLADLPMAQTTRSRDALKDEVIHSREISYLGQFPDQRLELDLHLIEHRLGRLITLYSYPFETALGAFESKYRSTLGFHNEGSARIRAFSGGARWQPVRGTDVQLALARTTMHAGGADAALVEQSGPRHTVGLFVRHDLPADWQLGAGYYRVGAMRTQSGGDLLPAVERVDVRLAKTIPLGSGKAEVALVVQNATGGGPLFERNDVDRRTSWLNLRYVY